MQLMSLQALREAWPHGLGPLHVTDVETTGTNPGREEILEVATVTLHGGEIVDRYQRLIKPTRRIPPFITKLTGIDEAMVATAAGRDEVLADWAAHVGKHPPGHFVAHNASFDLGFLRTGLYLAKVPWPFPEAHAPGCTVAWSRQAWPQLPSRSLGALIQRFAIQVDARHRALADTEATALLLGLLARGVQPEPQPGDRPVGGGRPCP